MSKKLEVLQMLKDAGDKGVRSDEFYKRFNGRGVARIYDLRQDGYEIQGRPDGKYKRYKLLNVGSSTEGSTQPSGLEDLAEMGSPKTKTFGVASGVAASPLLPVPVEAHARTIPSAYDCWEDAA